MPFICDLSSLFHVKLAFDYSKGFLIRLKQSRGCSLKLLKVNQTLNRTIHINILVHIRMINAEKKNRGS